MSLPEARAWILLSAVLFSAACADSPVEPLADGSFRPVAPRMAVAYSGFPDEFSIFDDALWSMESHPLGRGELSPSNIDVSDGRLRLLTPARTFDGAEIASRSRYLYGTYVARLRCGTPAGSLCAFFLYEGVSGGNDEIDIEIKAASRTIYLTTWKAGLQTNTVTLTLPFDPAADFHDYAIAFSASGVTFTIDRALSRTFTAGLPTNPMLIMANAWWPKWLKAKPRTPGGVMEIERIDAGY